MNGYTANVWKDIELRIYIYIFCISCKIYSTKKGYIEKSIQTKDTFKMGSIDFIPAIAPKSLQVRPIFLIIFKLLMHTKNLQNFMVWKYLLPRK